MYIYIYIQRSAVGPFLSCGYIPFGARALAALCRARPASDPPSDSQACRGPFVAPSAPRRAVFGGKEEYVYVDQNRELSYG